jgi:dihydroorotate dehydrogenase electron transfer subunit
VCDFFDGSLAIIYKIVGNGTKKLSRMARNEQLDVIFGLGNGFNLNVAKNSRNVVLIGGGVGIPPLYFVAKNLKKADVNFRTVLGFTSSDQVFFSDKFSKFSEVTIVTADGKVGEKGLVTDILGKISYDYYFTCGPLPMLKAIHKMSTVPGQLLFESRMACGFGACAACSLKTLSGSKKICTEGPMIYSDEVDFS